MGSHPRLLKEEQEFLVGTEHVLESSISPHPKEPTCVEHTLAFIKQMAHSHTQPSKETSFEPTALLIPSYGPVEPVGFTMKKIQSKKQNRSLKYIRNAAMTKDRTLALSLLSLLCAHCPCKRGFTAACSTMTKFSLRSPSQQCELM